MITASRGGGAIFALVPYVCSRIDRLTFFAGHTHCSNTVRLVSISWRAVAEPHLILLISDNSDWWLAL